MTRDTIRFWLDGTLHSVRNPDPTLTVLRYLRETMRRTATKEGCGEGDCGACTVVLADPADQPVFRAVNGCILFLPMIDGKTLYTVESLSRPDQPLHPVQQAMIDSNASQCGFCTPGIVMSLYAQYRNAAFLGDGEARNALAGNLCRCTGYGPIIDAARRMPHYAAEEEMPPQVCPDEPMLALSYDDPRTGTTRRYFAPSSLEDLSQLVLAHPGATLVAGGTDVGVRVTKRLAVLEALIAVGEVAALRQITDTPDAVEIGAAVRYGEAYAALAAIHPDIGEILRRLGSAQVRNVGTIGGNIANASPIGDTMPILIALGARLVLHRGGTRRVIALEDYFLGYGKQDRVPGEFVEKIIVPKLRGASFRAHKITKRFEQDISSVCSAITFVKESGRLRDVRLAFGGMAATPRRAIQAEAALEGKLLCEAVVHSAMAALEADFTPISDMRASARYRLLVAKNFLWRLWLASNGVEAVRMVDEEALEYDRA